MVSLIYQGQVSALPKYTAQGVEKVCRTQSQPYLNLLNDFNETDLDMFQENASSASALFESVSSFLDFFKYRKILRQFF